MSAPAFVPVGCGTFTRPGVGRSGVCARDAPARRAARSPVVAMAKGGGPFDAFTGAFKNKAYNQPEAEAADAGEIAEPQPGDPGYVAPTAEKFEFEKGVAPGPPSKVKAAEEAAAAEVVAKAAAAEEAKKTAAEPAVEEVVTSFQKPGEKPPAKKKVPEVAEEKQSVTDALQDRIKGAFGQGPKKTNLPVAKGSADVEEKKRGLQLLREDLFRNAPEIAGVGRQDQTAIMAPVYGEPGYKPKAYETAYVSELGISPFPDDDNAVGKVGGIAAVQKAALLAKKGRTSSDLKREFLKKPAKKVVSTVDLPDYLKPIPEDTTRKGLTWKNYDGR